MAKTTTLTKEEWLEMGFELFGNDPYGWKFKCPVCAHVQSFHDFEPYVDRGATPDSAFTVCIGKYQKSGEGRVRIGCNYSSENVLNVSPIRVTGPNREFYSFAFAPPKDQDE